MKNLNVGDRLGCYELLRKMGEDGMGMALHRPAPPRPPELKGACVELLHNAPSTLQLTVRVPKVSKKGDLFTMNYRITAVTLFRNEARLSAFKLDPNPFDKVLAKVERSLPVTQLPLAA